MLLVVAGVARATTIPPPANTIVSDTGETWYVGTLSITGGGGGDAGFWNGCYAFPGPEAGEWCGTPPGTAAEQQVSVQSTDAGWLIAMGFGLFGVPAHDAQVPTTCIALGVDAGTDLYMCGQNAPGQPATLYSYPNPLATDANGSLNIEAAAGVTLTGKLSLSPQSDAGGTIVSIAVSPNGALDAGVHVTGVGDGCLSYTAAGPGVTIGIGYPANEPVPGVYAAAESTDVCDDSTGNLLTEIQEAYAISNGADRVIYNPQASGRVILLAEGSGVGNGAGSRWIVDPERSIDGGGSAVAQSEVGTYQGTWQTWTYDKDVAGELPLAGCGAISAAGVMDCLYPSITIATHGAGTVGNFNVTDLGGGQGPVTSNGVPLVGLPSFQMMCAGNLNSAFPCLELGGEPEILLDATVAPAGGQFDSISGQVATTLPSTTGRFIVQVYDVTASTYCTVTANCNYDGGSSAVYDLFYATTAGTCSFNTGDKLLFQGAVDAGCSGTATLQFVSLTVRGHLTDGGQ